MDYSTYQQRLCYILELLSRETPLTPVSLALKFDCSSRTIRRMINVLRDEGHPIGWCRNRKCYYHQDFL